jgi:hypothetical protein
VPPIFQPEVAARAIVWAAEHRRREVWVGASTLKVILGGFVGPGVADRYLARTNVEDQQTNLPIEADRPHYLYEPMPDDQGAHGIFTEQAKQHSAAWARQSPPRRAPRSEPRAHDRPLAGIRQPPSPQSCGFITGFSPE